MKCARFALFALLALALPAHAFAPWTLSGLPGYGVGEHGFSGFSWGAAAEYKLDPTWEGGISWVVTSDEARTIIPIMFTVNYRHASMPGFYLGPRMGLSAVKTDRIGLNPSMSSSEFTWGAHLGYDHAISTEWSIGLNASLNLIMSGQVKGVANFLLPIKYQFY